MALIKCKECGKEISDKTTNCIHCGCPVEKKVSYKKEYYNLTKIEKKELQKEMTNKGIWLDGILIILYIIFAVSFGLGILFYWPFLIISFPTLFVYLSYQDSKKRKYYNEYKKKGK